MLWSKVGLSKEFLASLLWANIFETKNSKKSPLFWKEAIFYLSYIHAVYSMAALDFVF